jgi:hypothetical protein
MQNSLRHPKSSIKSFERNAIATFARNAIENGLTTAATLALAATIVLGCCFVTAAPASAQDSDDPLRAMQREYLDSIRPMIEESCGDCHWGDDADADLNLEPYQSLDQLLSGRKKWKKVLLRVAAKEMPPEDSEPFSDENHAAVMAWLDKLLNSVDCTTINPGRVTIRRLNRTEYRNTIRDLVGVEYKTEGNFPADDVGYGFDNIADVLSTSPILMEKYLKAAETISRQAIENANEYELQKTLTASKFEGSGGGGFHNNRRTVSSNGTVSASLNLFEKGTYRIFILAGGDQAGDEPVRMAIDFNGKHRKLFKVKNDADKFGEFVFETPLNKTGKTNVNISFLNDYYVPARNGKNQQDRNLHLGGVRLEGPIGKKSKSYQAIIGSPPEDNPKAQRTASAKAISMFASRAFRRRATQDEGKRLMALYDAARENGDSFEQAIRLQIQAVLISPHFLYKIESPVAPGQSRELTDFELATSLSYFLWSSMPDRELFGLASQGKLKQQEVFRAQVKRMLKDKRSSALVQNFAAQWLQLRSLKRMQPDPELFPGVNAQLRNDMTIETKLVIQELIQSDAQLTDLLKTDFTYLNERLAKHYGVPGVSGKKFKKVSSDVTKRKGLLTHASILTLTSNPNRTSPVKRGKWIMENLLGEEPPPPDPDAMQLEDQADLSGTLRQRMEQHRADPNCAVCHKVMDELGFALENFDPVGRWREKDEAGFIDSKGELPDGTTFFGADELQLTVRTGMRKQYIRCMTEKMLIYAIGRGLEYFDECTLDKIISEVQAEDNRFSALVIAVCESEPFRKRFGMPDTSDEE